MRWKKNLSECSGLRVVEVGRC